MNTQQFLLDKYGPIMTVAEVCEFLKMPYQTFMHRRKNKILGFNAWRDGTKVFVAAHDLAQYIDQKRGATNPQDEALAAE